MADYELIVIGAGPAGQKAALQAAKLKRRVAVIEREAVVGGACVSTGTLPSKTLRETVHYLAGLRTRNLSTYDGLSRKRVKIQQLMERKTQVIGHEIEIIQRQLDRNDVDVIPGEAVFVDPHAIRVGMRNGMMKDYTSENFIIATGSRPNMPPGLPRDHPSVLNSDSVLSLEEIPRTLTILGGGVIGSEYACIFACLGTKVTIVDRRETLMRFLDREISDALAYQMRASDITLKMSEQLDTFGVADDGRVETRLKSGKVVVGERLFCSMGRISNTESLGLDKLGIDISSTGLIKVNEHFQTAQPHIYAVGDVIGFPALASTSMEQGRLAACHALQVEVRSFPESFPYGIYTIPEISYAGYTEEELTERQLPYEVGRAEYNETARGQILGDESGVLKLLFHRQTLELLGVHIMGDSATELIHIGQAVIAHRGKITYFTDNVFNYPTLAECYKVAAFNGLNRL